MGEEEPLCTVGVHGNQFQGLQKSASRFLKNLEIKVLHTTPVHKPRVRILLGDLCVSIAALVVKFMKWDIPKCLSTQEQKKTV